MPLALSDDVTRDLASALQAYVRDEWGHEIGDLKASLLLEFVLAEVGPSAYNQGVRDAQAHLSRVVDDLDVAVYEPERARAPGETLYGDPPRSSGVR